MTAIFIIGLPRDHAGVLAISPGHGTGDPRSFLAIAAVAEAIMPPRTKAAWAAVAINRHHAGHLVDQPLGRRGCGRAQDHFQPGGVQCLDRPVKPAPVEPARFGFDPAPGKFTDPSLLQADCGHAPGIFCPGVFGPVFRIIASAKLHPAGLAKPAGPDKRDHRPRRGGNQ